MLYILVKNNSGVMGAIGPHPDHCNGLVHTPVLGLWLLTASETPISEGLVLAMTAT